MAILEVKNVGKRFDSTEVLKDIHFSLEEGETLVIIGSSGSGKTTLLRGLNFLVRLDTGHITLRDEVLFDSDSPNPYDEASIRQKRLHFGMVFQSFNLFPQYTALQNVTLAPTLAARNWPDFKRHKKDILAGIQQEGLELLEQMGLADKRGSYPHQLSGGQQQRVAIARALALSPDVLCFDEPTSALDPELTGEVLNVIRGLAEKKMTMIIVTHEMNFAGSVADTVLFMDGGVVVEHGPPRDVLQNPTNERIKRFLERFIS